VGLGESTQAVENLDVTRN